MSLNFPVCADDDVPDSITATCALQRKSISEIATMINVAVIDTNHANMFMRLFYLFSALGDYNLALDMQTKALERGNLFRIVNPQNPKIKLLVFMGPGDMTDNTPVDFLVENSDICVDVFYLSADNLPINLPEHDLAFIALGASNKNRPLLKRISKLLKDWPRPYLNHPTQILNCHRATAASLLQNIHGLWVPKVAQLRREQFDEILIFPCIIRPIDTHGGNGLQKIQDKDELQNYLHLYTDYEEFYVAEFVDYASQDGTYRKYRIALIDQKPFICHLAISENWMVHYRTSGMENSVVKRAEEQEVMENFAQSFLLRHHATFLAIAQRLKLDYVVLDCAETSEGQLLFFEADNVALIHAIDPIEVFPYKPRVMQKAFDAFRQMLLQNMQSQLS